MKIDILGSGIIALSTAVRAQELGHQARLLFTDPSARSTSDGFLSAAKSTSTSWAAAAFWTPFATGRYKRAWALDTLHRFRSLSQDVGSRAGVTLGAVYFYFQDREAIEEGKRDSLWWMSNPLTFAKNRNEVFVEPISVAVRDAEFRFRTVCRLPIVEMTRYLPYLVGYANEIGVEFQAKRILLDRSDVDSKGVADAKVVACGGWTPATLGISDDELTGISGQIFESTFSDASGIAHEVHSAQMADGSRPVYVVTNAETAWLGGTAFSDSFELGRHGPDYCSVEESRVTEEVQQLTGQQLSTATDPFDRRVGIRPYRTSVRIEKIVNSDLSLPVVASYGHGGAGISLSWGSANEAIRLLEGEDHSTFATDGIHSS